MTELLHPKRQKPDREAVAELSPVVEDPGCGPMICTLQECQKYAESEIWHHLRGASGLRLQTRGLRPWAKLCDRSAVRFLPRLCFWRDPRSSQAKRTPPARACRMGQELRTCTAKFPSLLVRGPGQLLLETLTYRVSGRDELPNLSLPPDRTNRDGGRIAAAGEWARHDP